MTVFFTHVCFELFIAFCDVALGVEGTIGESGMLLLEVVLIVMLIVVPESERCARGMLAPFCAVFVLELVFIHINK